MALDFECEERAGMRAWRPPCKGAGAQPFWAAFSPQEPMPDSDSGRNEGLELEHDHLDGNWLQQLLHDPAHASEAGWLVKLLRWARVHGSSSEGVVGFGDRDKLEAINACVAAANCNFNLQGCWVTSGRWHVSTFDSCVAFYKEP